MITFFDIPCKISGRAWSPNTWKVRYALNYKGVPYRTQWVEFPDIETVCKARGIPPTGTKNTRSTSPEELYTLPAIFDSTTNAAISNSATIIQYLDSRYPTPTKPLLFPKGTRALQASFQSAFVPKIKPLWMAILPTVTSNLNTYSEAYFKADRERTFGVTMEDLKEDIAGRQENWDMFRKGMSDVARWIDKNEDVEGPFMMGEHPIFADLVIGALLAYVRNVWGEEGAQWADMKTWDRGKWAVFVEALREYEAVK